MTTQTTTTNIDNDNASTRASAKPKNGRKGSRTTIETFKRCVAATVKARVNAAENPTLFEQREEERGALVWCALTLAPNMFQEEKRDRETAVAYVRGEYPTITEKEANSYISAASDNDSRRQRCTDVRKAAWRDVEYGRMSQDDAAKLGQVIKGLLPPRGERQFERMFDRCGDGLKESTARMIAKIIMNDSRYSDEERAELLAWLEQRVAKFCGDAVEARAWMDRQTMPRRPANKNHADRLMRAPRPSHRDDSGTLKPRGEPQYKASRTETYEPPEEEVQALAKRIADEREKEGKRIDELDARRRARGQLIQVHCEAQRKAKKEAKRAKQEATEKAAKDAKAKAAEAKAAAEAKSEKGKKGRERKAA
jgi:hypothetical protein